MEPTLPALIERREIALTTDFIEAARAYARASHSPSGKGQVANTPAPSIVKLLARRMKVLDVECLFLLAASHPQVGLRAHHQAHLPDNHFCAMTR